MSGFGGERVECSVCGHAWRLTALDVERNNSWCDMCMEPRRLDGSPPSWLNRQATPEPDLPPSRTPSASASGIGLLLKRQSRSEASASPISLSRRPTPAPSAGQGYPATILQRMPSRRQATVAMPGPLVRHLHRAMGVRPERTEQGEILVIATGDVRARDRVLVRVREGLLYVAEVLKEEHYIRETNRMIRSALIRDSQPMMHIDEVRAARLRLENWLQLPRDDRNPWSLPGELRAGSVYLSRQILEWCQARSGSEEPPEAWLQRGFPDAEEWGPGAMPFCARLEETQPARFNSLVVSSAEHQAQQDAWKRLMADEPEDQGPPVALPDALLALMTRLNLPHPRGILEPGQAVLAGWSEAGSAALARRAMAMFLLDRVENETQQAALRGLGVTDRRLEVLYQKWRDAGRPTLALSGIVEDDELHHALQAMSLTREARAICDGLLQRWGQQLTQNAAEEGEMDLAEVQQQRKQAIADLEQLRQQSTELRRRREAEVAELESRMSQLRKQIASVAPLLVEEAPEHLPERAATREAVQLELAARGLPLSLRDSDRLLLAALAAPDAGALVVLSAPSAAIAPMAASALGGLFARANFAQIAIRSEWKSEADLLGRLSPDGQRFLPGPLTEATRRAAAHALVNAMGTDAAPFILHLAGVDRADPQQVAAGLLSALGADRRMQLYPRSLNARWLAEREEMRAHRSREGGRLAELEQAFSDEALGGTPPEKAWRLHLPQHLSLLASRASNDRPLSGALLEHSFMVTLPPMDLAAALAPPPTEPRGRLILPPRPEAPADYPQARAHIEAGLRTLLPAMPPPSPRLGRQIAALLAEAARWEMPDDNALAAHALLLLALPRLRTDQSTAEVLANLATQSWLTDELTELIGMRMLSSS
ncbi:MAG: hypothetical protein AAFV53_18330 [Myxococcota bacterium]